MNSIAWIDIWHIIIFTNTILALWTVFHRKRSVATSWAWLIVLIIFPVIGFVIYGFVGRGISQENLFAINRQHHIGLDNVQKMITKAPKKTSAADTSPHARILIKYLDKDQEAPITKNNQLKLYTDGVAKFKDLFADIRAAKSSINVEYYTIYDDQIGNQFMDLLIKKAKEGVQVRVLYDAWGSLGARKKWFNRLVKAGGDVLPFITSRNMISRNRINYHLHRKIVVIDGVISWTGGFNVGDQYLGRKKKFGYWRDTHLRLVGSASLLLQERFVMDWNASAKKEKEVITFDEKLFPDLDEQDIRQGDMAVQVVSDGPDNDDPYMRNGLVRLMMLARQRVWIQTPYLIPDEAMIAAWQILVNSGVDLRIMIPCMPDHPFIYRATQWYANQLTKIGVKIYTYKNGFLHAKTIIVDDKFATVGSVNQDYRSYDLNFEDNVFVYDRGFNREMAKQFKADMAKSTLLTPEMIAKQSHYLHFKQNFSRLLSPIL